MFRKLPPRLLALPLALTLAASPAAQALTPEQTRTLLRDYYIDEVSAEVLDQTSIQSMLETLGDPYTVYFSPEEYQDFAGSMSDTELVGIGISSRITEEGPLIQRIYEDTPAADAGLQPGDLITSVDGRDAAGQDAATVAEWLQGEPGTQVRIRYLRDGAEYTAVLTRRAITVPATYTELREGHIGYIDCDTFGGETAAHFAQGMGDAAQADRWIVDLRGNGGGVVNAAMEAASCFTGPGTLAYLKDGTGAYGAYGSNNEALTDQPVLVLTDGATASASELFASDIRDTGTGLLVGGRTFGKGVAQTVLDQEALPDYFADGDAIKITSYRFYAPGGSTTDTVGLIPDLLVDADLAGPAAMLLSAPAPEGSTEGYLRLTLGGWDWYIRLDEALSGDANAAFTALLEALPAGTPLQEGTGGEDSWADVSAETLAERYSLTGYQARGFTDTDASPYAVQIHRLATYGILSGSGDGSFAPTGTLTRAQLCALLAQALNCRVPTGESQFTDVSMEDWYGQCVNAVARLGLVDGVGGGRFAPDAPVTQEQLITILARMAQRLSMRMEQDAEEAPENFESSALLPCSTWAREPVWLLALSQKGLLGNPINLLWAPLEDIRPSVPATREEAAALTYNLLHYLGILPS